MFTYGATQVAFVGVTTPESFTKSTPAYFQDSQGNYIYSFCEDESGQKLYDQVQASVDAARTAGADYVILAGHLGENGITQKWSSASVIANTTGIDACIDGHSHETVPENVKNKNGQNVVLTQTGTKLNHIGKLTISADGSIRTELVSEVPAADLDREYTVQEHDSLSRIAKRELGSYNRWIDIYNSNLDKIKNADVIPVGLNIVIPGKSYINPDGKAADYGTYQFIQSIENQYNETLKTVLGTTPYELTVNDPATGNRIIRNAETNLGDLTADAYRAELGADIGLSNGGGIRSVIKPGNITYNDTLAVFPYGNMGCVIEATGQQIKDALEMASRNCPEESGGFLQVSGLTYTIDTSVKSGVQTDDKGNFTGVSGAYRVMDIKVGGEPIDLNKTYTVASHNYMLKQGGDGMTMFKGCNVIRDEVMVDVDILSSYIRRMGGSVTSEYANPGGQGRISIR
jgi:5'-nucleotidase/UDP-sugar diphosphatase